MSRNVILQILGCVLVGAGCESAVADEAPRGYVLSYPAAEQFCPPVDGFLEEVVRTIDRVKNRTFRHQPNGGYGLPVVDRVGDAHLLHLGADVGWYRVGEPVFAVANGVVRVSEGPPKADVEGKEKKAPSPGSLREQPSLRHGGSATKGRGSGSGRGRLEWGNVIVLEHRLANGKFATTVYGHLADARLVKVGDVVRAGQPIGTIGTTRVNGGYKPHLHFGVREGRMAEVGRKLALLSIDGKQLPLEIAEVREDAILLAGAKELPERMQLTINGETFEITKKDDKAEVAAAFLSHVPSPEFAIVGYGLTTDGWLDPIAFLKSHAADIHPAPFGAARRRGVVSKE